MSPSQKQQPSVPSVKKEEGKFWFANTNDDRQVRFAKKVILTCLMMFLAFTLFRVFGKDTKGPGEAFLDATCILTLLTAFSIGYMAGRSAK